MVYITDGKLRSRNGFLNTDRVNSKSHIRHANSDPVEGFVSGEREEGEVPPRVLLSGRIAVRLWNRSARAGSSELTVMIKSRTHRCCCPSSRIARIVGRFRPRESASKSGGWLASLAFVNRPWNAQHFPGWILAGPSPES